MLNHDSRLHLSLQVELSQLLEQCMGIITEQNMGIVTEQDMGIVIEQNMGIVTITAKGR